MFGRCRDTRRLLDRSTRQHSVTVNNLGNLYTDQGKLAEAEQMYVRALQGYEEALGNHVSSYSPALNTMFNLGHLFSKTNRAEMAEAMYKKAWSGFAAVQSPSSNVCRDIKRRLEGLSIPPTEPGNMENAASPVETRKSRFLVRRFLDRIKR